MSQRVFFDFEEATFFEEASIFVVLMFTRKWLDNKSELSLYFFYKKLH